MARRRLTRIWLVVGLIWAVGCARRNGRGSCRTSSTRAPAIGETRTPLDAVSVRLRSSERNVGNLLADAIRGVSFTIDSGAPSDRKAVDVPDFIFKGGDGYAMFPGGQVLVAPESGNLIVDALEKYVAAKRVIAPQVEGRIRVR